MSTIGAKSAFPKCGNFYGPAEQAEIAKNELSIASLRLRLLNIESLSIDEAALLTADLSREMSRRPAWLDDAIACEHIRQILERRA